SLEAGGVWVAVCDPALEIEDPAARCADRALHLAHRRVCERQRGEGEEWDRRRIRSEIRIVLETVVRPVADEWVCELVHVYPLFLNERPVSGLRRPRRKFGGSGRGRRDSRSVAPRNWPPE